MKIALIGYGKMGREIERVALLRGHDVVSIIDRDNREDFDSPAFLSADVAIEFTAPDAAFGNVKEAFARGVKVVSGTTGWIDKHGKEIDELCTNGATLLWASNFSIGVAVFAAVNKYLATLMNRFANYDVSMTEVHHVHKLDAPSGTAITLADQIVERLDRKHGWVKGETGDAASIGIRSIREGEVPGVHSICYESEADKLTITHEAKNRSGFALGAVLAAEYACGHKGRLSLEEMFGF